MTAGMPASVTTNLDDDAAVGLLHGLVAAPSVSGAEQPAVSYLVNAMRRLGLDAWVDETGNAVGCAGEGSPEIVLLGHIDTVPGDVPVRIEDGLLYGRGAVDAKGPLAAFAMAAARLQACGLLRGRIVVIGCVEEEAPSSRGAHGVLGRYHPDFCIVGEPSGVGAITLGYKGSLRARVRLTQPCAHSAHDGQSVAERGCRLWEQVRAWAGEVNRGRDRAWEQVLPALLRISSGGDGLYEWCELDLSIRLPEDFTPGIVEARLREIAGTGEVEVLGAVSAFRSGRDSVLARALIAGIRAQGDAPRFVVKTGTSDMNLVGPAWGCPTLTYGPGDSRLDHTPDEHISLVEYLAAIRVLEHALAGLLNRRG